jgi:uncharacterized membrane protein YfcA
MVILGYSLAILVGCILGLTGSGGAILTVPVLVYCFGIKPTVATGYSLLIVGCTALLGALRYQKRGHIHWQATWLFGIPAMLMMWITRTMILPILPDPLFIMGSTAMSKDSGIMLFFASLMLLAATFMLFHTQPSDVKHKQPLSFTRIALCIAGSMGIGLLSGMLGVGGGFLIIPTLIGLLGIRMREAIGTSLILVTVNSLVGFAGDLVTGIPLDWSLLTAFLALALIGVWGGTALSHSISATKLKRGFGLFVLFVGIFIFTRECASLVLI